VKQAFEDLGFGVCTRIDGFLDTNGVVVLHDPNTIPGMSPSSLIFKQMAEIGLNVTDSLTYFIRQSIRERLRTGKNYYFLNQQLKTLDAAIATCLQAKAEHDVQVLEISGSNEAELEASFQAVKSQAAELAALGTVNVRICTPLEIEEGETLINLHVAHVGKDSAKEMLEAIKTGVHPLIAHTRQAAIEITKFYTNV
jgi:D-alanine-D-alanine ligase